MHDKSSLAPGVFRLSLEPLTRLTWRAGQFVNLRGPTGALRSSTLACTPTRDYFGLQPFNAHHLCDGCQREIEHGELGRVHRRTGELFCVGCSSRAAPAPAERRAPTSAPPPA